MCSKLTPVCVWVDWAKTPGKQTGIHQKYVHLLTKWKEEIAICIRIMQAPYLITHAKICFNGTLICIYPVYRFSELRQHRKLQSLLQGRPGPIYPMQFILGLLMPWWHKRPGHQQQWYWRSFPRHFSVRTSASDHRVKIILPSTVETRK